MEYSDERPVLPTPPPTQETISTSRDNQASGTATFVSTIPPRNTTQTNSFSSTSTCETDILPSPAATSTNTSANPSFVDDDIQTVVDSPTVTDGDVHTETGLNAATQAMKTLSVISFNARVQALMDKYRLGWAVQYEIARGVADNFWTWDVITEAMVKKLSGSNMTAAPLVARTILPEEGASRPAVTERLRLI